MWGLNFKRKTSVPDDTGEAEVISREAQEDLRYLKRQSPEVESLMRKLVRRRELNHFGQDLSVTFNPRGGRL